MGGVDLVDMLTALYRTKLRMKKFYMRIFGQLIDLAINNAWVLFKRDYLVVNGDNTKMPLKKFRLLVAEHLALSKNF